VVFPFFFDTIQPRHESFDRFSLALLYLSPFSLPIRRAALSTWPQETVMKKQKDTMERRVDRQANERLERGSDDWWHGYSAHVLRNAKEMMDHLAAAWCVPLT
jgi:hypothetical protein